MDLTTAGHEGMGAAEPGLIREKLKAERIQAAQPLVELPGWQLKIQGGGVTVTLSSRTGGLTEAELGLAETLAQ